jgi:outer membrane lipoprotein-sorting protein
MRLSREARSRTARWAVPGVAVVAVGGAIAASAVTVAQAEPALAPKTPAQLLAQVAAVQRVPALTGAVVETPSLGLPRLPNVGNPASLTSLVTGSHLIKVYWRDQSHYRLAVPQTMNETDFIRNGKTGWLWESASNSVTKFALGGRGKQAPGDGLPPLTPQQAASQALNAVGKTTVVSVESTLSVAGQAAYQLVLAPKDSRSTIATVRIAIDGKTGVPLRVQVFAKGSASPAFQIGYTSISYVAPAAANFAFTPPPGAAFQDTTSRPAGRPARQAPAEGTYGTFGHGWLTVAELPGSLIAGSRAASPAPSGGSGTAAFGADSQAALHAFLGGGTQVRGTWGAGRLIHTSLFNVLVVGNEVYAGAVQPSVLYAAVGHVNQDS